MPLSLSVFDEDGRVGELDPALPLDLPDTAQHVGGGVLLLKRDRDECGHLLSSSSDSQSRPKPR
jgi:hypothetical protein